MKIQSYSNIKLPQQIVLQLMSDHFYLPTASAYTASTFASWLQNTDQKFKKRKRTLPVTFILVNDSLSSFECFCFRNTALSLPLFFNPGKMCESSRAINMVGLLHLRNGLSLRPKGEIRNGFNFTISRVPLSRTQKT